MTPPGPACPRCGEYAEPAAEAHVRLAAAEEAPHDREAPHDPEAPRALVIPDTEDARLALVDALAPPEEPHAFSLGGWLALLLIPIVNVLSIFISPLTRGLKTFVAAMAAVWVASIVWFASGTFPDPFAARDAAMMVGLVTLIIYCVALVHSWVHERREVRQVLLPAYRARRDRWEGLAWCSACGVAFLEGTDRVARDPEDIAALLGPASPGPTRSARTPIWMWVLLSFLAVWGVRGAVALAPWAARPEEPPLPAPTPDFWDDIAPDPVAPPPSGGKGPLDAPLVTPPPGG